MNSTINKVIKQENEVSFLKYLFLPMWQMIRKPFQYKELYIQGKTTVRDTNNKIIERRWYIEKFKNL